MALGFFVPLGVTTGTRPKIAFGAAGSHASEHGHQQEQHDLIETLMAGDIYNEGEYGAKSTFTAILGREACYSDKVIKWDELLTKGRDLAPGIDQYTLETAPPTVPDSEGNYPHPTPGKYNPFV